MAKAKRQATPERTWVALPDPAPGAQEPIYVSFPAPPDDEALAEATGYLKGLEERGQIVRDPGHAAPGATHELEVDVTGKKRLVRKRFSAR
jgi:hypothetical protein